MSSSKIMIPPRMGGGDFVMREISAGEYEDRLKAGVGGADTAWVDRQAEAVCSAIATFRGKTLEKGSAGEAWWRSNSAALRQFLIGCYNKINAASDKEIEDFFAEAEAVPDLPTTR